MPEGHTIHRMARDVSKDLLHKRLVVSSPQGRVNDIAAELDGTSLTKAEAYGKHLALHCAAASTANPTTREPVAILNVHLGLIGRFIRSPAGTPERDTIRLRITTDEAGSETANKATDEPGAAIWDLIAPNTCRIINPGDWDRITSKLGPDPLRRGVGTNPKAIEAFQNSLARKNVSLATALLDQKVVAGIGNVFRSELAFLIGVDPHRASNSLSPQQATELWQTIVEQLRQGVRLNRIVTITPEDAKAFASTTPGRLQDDERLYVYKRQGEPCRRCGTPISVDEKDGRRFWWCSRCQN